MTDPAGRAGPGDRRRGPYAVEPWVVREVGVRPADASRSETVFSLANGHLGLRGSLDEGRGIARGTYINGFHERTPIVYGETAHGLARNHQMLLNIADGKRIGLEVNGERLDLRTGRVEGHERSLDLRTGILTRRLRWVSPSGCRVRVTTRRLVSLTRRSVAMIDYEAELLDAPGGGAEVRLVSTLEARVANRSVSTDPRVGSLLPRRVLRLVHREAADTGGVLVQRTHVSQLAVAAAVRHDVRVTGSRAGSGRAGDAGVEVEQWASASGDGISSSCRARLEPGDGLRLTKTLAYCSSLDIPEDGLAGHATELALAAAADGFEVLAGEQARALGAFWRASDVEIEGDDALQQAIRYSLFSVFQAAGRDGKTGLAAKGLTSASYHGHFFWDTEVFSLPFLVYTQPQIARALLEFRIRTLPQARARAAEMNEDGALFPWRTINGEEASPYFPAGTAQYHINADIALALVRYLRATGDRSLLLDGGAELLIETARLWLSLGAYVPAQGGAFCINEVTGPDEYTALVNNNAYTNLMARAHLREAARIADELAREEPAAWDRITASTGLSAEEIAAWRRAADLMRVPHDPELGVHLQDDAFLDREPWDFAGTPASLYPLLLHFHPLVIYRHRVLKQADMVLAQVLLPDEFSLAEKRRNFDFYDPLTTGDSSLSPCVQSIAAAELGHGEAALRYFTLTARMDLDDVNGNTADGAHMAAMAGSWLALVCGFAGMRDSGAQLSFAPRLPATWRRLAFRLLAGRTRLRMTLTPAEAAYEVERGGPIEILHFGQPLTVGPGRPVRVDLRPRLRAVVFDLDGVLTDTAELHFQAWRRLADEESLPFDRALNERLKGVGRLDSLGIILDHAGRAVPDPAERARLAERKNAHFAELIGRLTPADLLPGMGPLLADLRAAGVRTAIASASHNAPEVIRRLEIGQAIDAIVDPRGLVRGKPDPEIFLTAAEMLGVRPEDCVGIEDAAVGIEAIRAAGMVAVGIGPSLPGADWVVTDTRELSVAGLAELVRRGRGPAAAVGRTG